MVTWDAKGQRDQEDAQDIQEHKVALDTQDRKVRVQQKQHNKNDADTYSVGHNSLDNLTDLSCGLHERVRCGNTLAGILLSEYLD